MEKRLSIYLELFKRKQFDFITVRNDKKHEKQEQALQVLTDNTTAELMFGGAAGGAKSWTGCVWLAFMCLLYPETKWFIGREELKRLRDSTLLTFFRVCKAYGIEKEVDFKYNGQDYYIEFFNGSRIDLLDLKYLPSDPLFERYGSVEYTGGFIEEAGEVDFNAFDTLKSRVGRQLNDHYGLLRKIYLTCNPKRNWIYSYFYRPFKSGMLAPHQSFLPSLLFDNPHVESNYEAALKSITDPIKKARLLHGSFEYDDDPAQLCDLNAINDLFTNDHVQPGEKAISADLAMQGRDRFVAGVWDGLLCRIAIDQEKSSGKSIERDIKKLMSDEQIGHSQVIADSDGLGAYLESYLEGIQTFHGGAKANNEEYANLKSECAYKLAELVNRREIKIFCTHEQKERITEELAVLKADSVDADERKKRIIKKDKMKESLQRSPDYLDMLLMRMYFLVQPKDVFWIITERGVSDPDGNFSDCNSEFWSC
jgi:phage terminase large subunit